MPELFKNDNLKEIITNDKKEADRIDQAKILECGQSLIDLKKALEDIPNDRHSSSQYKQELESSIKTAIEIKEAEIKKLQDRIEGK